MGQIFVSYSRKDKSFVDQLARDLQQSGVDIWIDRKGIEGGERWRATIVDAIRACDAFLIVLSPQSVASDNVAKELALGDRHRRRIIPVLYQSCEIPPQMEYQLAELQHIDFVAGYNEALGKLVRALGAHDFMPPTEEEIEPEPPQFPPSTPTSPPPGLMQILPGTWQVQIGSTMTGIVGQMTIELGPNYYFRGQLATAMTVSSALCVRVGMRLYSSTIFTRMPSQARQAMRMSSIDCAFTRSAGKGLPSRSAIVICG